MKQTYKVLIIDDHPIIIEAYKNVLETFSSNNIGFNFKIDSTNCITDTVSKIKDIKSENMFDLILLDINLPSCNKNKMFSGEELGVYIKNKFPNTKLIVITSLNDNLRLLNIFSNLNPDGFIIKSDIISSSLLIVIKSILDGKKYYSETVSKVLCLKAMQNVQLDQIDKNILKELANGSNMKELLQLIPLTKSGIERRKRILKKIFHVITDRDLVLIAREKGFI